MKLVELDVHTGSGCINPISLKLLTTVIYILIRRLLLVLRILLVLYPPLSCCIFTYFLLPIGGFPGSSVGKESACNAGHPSLILGTIHWRWDRLCTPVFLSFPCGSTGKESACNEGDLGSIPGLGRSSGEGKGYPLQYSDLENSMD